VAGAPGANGVSGYEQITNSTSSPGGFITTIIVPCSSGKVVTGGGVTFATNGMTANDIAAVTVVMSGPFDHGSYISVVKNAGTVTAPTVFTAICIGTP
jgi:hypothetical protein